MSPPGSWCLIESDPGVFTELVKNLGVKGIEFQELYSVDQLNSLDANGTLRPPALLETFVSVQPMRVYGLIFLFKWTPNSKEPPQSESVIACPHRDLFFASQVIPNACATQALLSLLLNCSDENSNFSIGRELSEFKEFTQEFDPYMKGLSITNSEMLRSAHNSFKPGISFFDYDDEGDSDKKREDAFHYVSYVPFNGICYELDGLQPSPRAVGDIPEGTKWFEIAGSAIMRRISEIQKVSESSEIRFCLLAAVDDHLLKIGKLIDLYRLIRQRIQIKLASFGEDLQSFNEIDDDTDLAGIASIEDLPENLGELHKLREALDTHIDTLQYAQEKENDKHQRWAEENARRRHQLAPFTLCAIRHLARRGELREAYVSAQSAAISRPI